MFPRNRSRRAARVSVVMPTHNRAQYLGRAVVSALSQTFRDIELVIVDDFSSDNTPVVLEELGSRDSRIVHIRNTSHLGVTRSLNVGLHAARGSYVARMDDDDLCDPDRLKEQVAYLDAHPSTVLVGAGCEVINDAGGILGVFDARIEEWEFDWLAFFHSPIVHSSAMFRASNRRGQQHFYDESRALAQDYALWVELLRHGSASAIPRALVQYRMHPDNISSRARTKQARAIVDIGLRRIVAEFPGLATRRPEIMRLLETLHGLRTQIASDSVALRSIALAILEHFARSRGTTKRQKIALSKIIDQWLATVTPNGPV
jgi:glycosyltransferase involved in cell wall biosynthesis